MFLHIFPDLYGRDPIVHFFVYYLVYFIKHFIFNMTLQFCVTFLQVLWHMDTFRQNFRLLSDHACIGSYCVFCALKVST